MKELIQATTNDGRKWYVETKGKVLARQVYPKGIYPQSSESYKEIGGHRIILPDGKTTFIFYSDVERSFAE